MGDPDQLAGATAQASDDRSGRLLETVRKLVVDLHPHRKRDLEVKWESRLDRDLGIDSLGRAELLSRVERLFRVRLPEKALAEVETPRDLLKALQRAGASTAAEDESIEQARSVRVETGATVAAPADAATLTEALDWHAERHADRPHIVLWDEAGREAPITYRALADDARAVARGLLARGFEPGGRAALMLPTGKAFFQAFFGILYAGGIPVPIYPPARLSQLEDHLRRQARILDNAGVSALVTVPEARAAAAFLRSHVHSLRWVETADKLRSDGATRGGESLRFAAAGNPENIALLQYTSGSTGDPKGVTLTHANLLANIRAFGERLEIDSSDVCVTWLPLYHDMGLIGTWLGSLYFAGPVVVLSPLTFLARPEQWLRAIHRHGGTVSAAPNFAFELCLRKIDDSDIEGLDLSSWRWALNGAEPVSRATIERFTERFAKFGFRADAMAPVYGMAENSVGLTIPPPGRAPIIDRVDRAAMTRNGEARAAEPGDENALEFINCGSPLRGHQVRIVDSLGREIGERRQGRLQFRGPSATQGYYRNEAATRQLFDGEWLNSGDLAYIAEGDVYITGRSKDIIIRAGRNLYPQELEEVVGNIEGVRKGCVAVFASTDAASGTELVVVLAETRLTSDDDKEALTRRIEEAAADVLESAPDEVVLVAPQTVPKTSSGKIRRAAARQLYEKGQLSAGRRALWRQMARLGVSGAAGRFRRAVRNIGDLLYSAWFWAVLAVVAPVTWLLVALLPRRSWRFGAFRAAAHLVFAMLAIPVDVSGRGHLSSRGGILVANHASYLDGLALARVLPRGFSVVAKKELLSNFVTRVFLRGLGAIFVERFQAAGSVEDSRSIVESARAGETVLIFPEGTFTRMPGLLAFRMGAFAAAAESGLAVTPVTLRGTRSILRDGQWLPGRAPIHVEISEPLHPDGGDFDAALRLRDRARREILSRCAEPDLAGESTILG